MNPIHPQRFPEVSLEALDTLWFQVGGTLCNLRCRHCFISCAPDNHRHEMLTLETVRRYLEEAVHLGVREYYFTGGEPFLNRELFGILAETLKVGPASVLTNGLLLDAERCRKLKALSDQSEYSLDLRISLDGWGPADHDQIRGVGTFDRTLGGIRELWCTGLNPVITVTEAAEDVASTRGRKKFLERLRSFGLEKPRFKVLPLFRMGAEETRTRAYHAWESLRKGEEISTCSLQCSSCRMVTSQGVFVCPILIDSPEARMGATLEESLPPFELAHPACYTCHLTGMSCRT